MFGYVKADKPNMLIKDHTEYRAYYCGLCKTLGRRYSQLTRISINYDITFLTLLAHNYRKIETKFSEGRCIIHMLSRKFLIADNDLAQEIVADLNIILGYHKALDDVLDGGNVAHRAVLAFLKRKYKKAAAKFPDVAQSTAKHYEQLRCLEKSGETSLDKLSDPFAKMLTEICIVATGKTDDFLEELCYNLGKWIYIIDAYDDLMSDYENNKFNPLNPMHLEISDELANTIYETAKFNLLLAVKNIRDAYDAMDISISEGPLSNVIYCGLRAKTNAVLEKRGTKCHRTLL
ncbi:MAG: DUF5685 family protein [Christensenellaceae bacterium]|jgi:hypothetical protein|nr:DUF5685 family protein [Christensenellaceae bacterium]